VSQGTYTMKILAALGLAGCNPCHMPMETHLKLSKSSSTPAVDPIRYYKIVGAMPYL
jgi:hypothetical protein